MKTNSITSSVTANDMEDEIFADLAMRFANRPLYRLSFKIDDGAVETLIKQFPREVCRAYRRRDEAGQHWNQLVLRFDEFAFVHVRSYSYKQLRIFADSLEKAEALEKQLRELLPPPVRTADEPWFYMLRKDGDEFAIEKITNKSPGLDEESLQICYGADSSAWVEDFAKNTQAKAGGITILDGPPGTGKSTLSRS